MDINKQKAFYTMVVILDYINLGMKTDNYMNLDCNIPVTLSVIIKLGLEKVNVKQLLKKKTPQYKCLTSSISNKLKNIQAIYNVNLLCR